MILKLNDEKFVNSLVYHGMAYCFNDTCPKAGACFRHLAAQFKPSDKKSGNAIYPDALQDGHCDYFIRPRIMKAAWGLGSLYNAVKHQDVCIVKSEIMAALGGRTSYYRYHRGEKLLTPEQQSHIEKVFAAKGYASPSFEHYKETVDFTSGDAGTCSSE